jgi:tetratricopeptide (TPR) repeat protein
MRALGILISILIAVTTPCPAQEGSRYIREEKSPGSPVIIFLHGVLGDSNTTWSDGNAYWPELLTKDDAFSGTSIFVHQYKTEMFKRGQLNIDELAEELKVRLDAHGVMQHGQLIFIAHSMGGLIARTLLLKYSDVAHKTRFIFFLSTPTSGATIANWAELVSSRNPQFREMRWMKSSDFLANIQRNWMAKGYTCTISSYCLYEKEETYATLVVDQGSASSLCNKPLVPVQADHIGIAKPSNQSAVQYQAFRNDFNAEISSSKLALVDRGVAYLAKRDYNRALEVFNEAIRLDPEYAPAIKNRGAVYLDTFDWSRAINDYNKAIYLEPKYAEHYYNRGASYSGMGDYDPAIADYTEAIRLNFYNKALALYYRGIAKQMNRDSKGGKADIAAARAIDPNVGK